jgi:pyrimidine operon attenuation protein/uracil phosphoribosyltransferase
MNVIIPPQAQKILDQQQIVRKIDRMSFQLLEITHLNEEIVIIGIEDGGFHLAGRMAMKMQTIRDIKIHLTSLYINKTDPTSEPSIIRDLDETLKNKTIILVDDVGNSGRTLFYALSALYPLNPASVHVAVLVDRTHKRFPIKADIVGVSLATTLTEHIHVVFQNDGVAEGAYLY